MTNAPSGVTRLRKLILTLAVQGRLICRSGIYCGNDRYPVRALNDESSRVADQDQLVGKLSKGWVLEPLGNLVEVLDNLRKPVTKEDRRPGPYPYFGASGVVDYVDAYLFDEPLVLVGEDGAKWDAGESTAFMIAGKSWVNNHAHVLRPDRTKLLDAYLVMFLIALDLQPYVTGMTVPKLNQGRLVSIPISVPPLDEQKMIVARVDELMQLCDALEAKGRLEAQQHARLLETLLGTLTDSTTPEELAANWQRVAEHLDLLLDRPEAVDVLEQTVLQLAVRGTLVRQDANDEPASHLLRRIRSDKDRLVAEGKIKGDKPLAMLDSCEVPFDIPVGWDWVRLGSIAGIERGGSPRPIEAFLTDSLDGLNWIKIGDTEKGGKYITSARERIRPEGLSKTRKVYPGDFLLTNSMSFGRPYITQIEGCIHDGWLRISPPSSLNKDYLYLLLSSSFMRELFVAAAAGGVVQNLNADKVRGVPIPLPPLAEQTRIVTRVTELLHLCADLRQRLAASQATQSRLAEALVGSALA